MKMYAKWAQPSNAGLHNDERKKEKFPDYFFYVRRYQASVTEGLIPHHLEQWGCGGVLSTGPRGKHMVW